MGSHELEEIYDSNIFEEAHEFKMRDIDSDYFHENAMSSQLIVSLENLKELCQQYDRDFNYELNRILEGI